MSELQFKKMMDVLESILSELSYIQSDVASILSNM